MLFSSPLVLASRDSGRGHSGRPWPEDSGAAPQKARPDRVATVTAVALPDGRQVSIDCWPGEGSPMVLLHGLLDCAVG